MRELADYILSHNINSDHVWRRHRTIKKLIEATLPYSTDDNRRSEIAATEVLAQLKAAEAEKTG